MCIRGGFVILAHGLWLMAVIELMVCFIYRSIKKTI